MSQEPYEYDNNSKRFAGTDYSVAICDTVLTCKMEDKVVIAGMGQALSSAKNIEAHLASIAQSLASIDRSLAVFAAAQTKPEEK